MIKHKQYREIVRPIGQEIRFGGVDSVLSALFRKIIYQTGIGTARFNQLMEQFLSDKRNLIPQNIKERSSARGNLRKELLKSTMTWKVFCKGLSFLNITKFEISIRLHHANGVVTEHSEVVNLNSRNAPVPHALEEDTSDE